MAWLRLFRIAALPSAISNILLGFLLAHGQWHPVSSLFLLLLTSASFYIAGMVLNDVEDVEQDRIERPNRPLPAGEITLRSAKWVGFLLLFLGLAGSLVVSTIHSTSQPLVLGLILLGCILLYNSPLKRTAFGPVLMGGCRMLNILLGASTATSAEASWATPLIVWWIAIAIGVFIAGVTWLGAKESRERSTGELVMPALVIGLGLCLFLATCCFREFEIADRPRRLFPWLTLLIAFPILRRLFVAVTEGTPATIQQAIVTMIRSLIVLDAAAVWLVAKDQLYYPLIVLALLIPAFLLGRVSKIT